MKSLDLLHSARITAPTRAAFAERVEKQSALAATAPRLLDAPAFATLCVLVDRLLPQDSAGPRVPVAAWIDERAAAGAGDGWRYDALPPDPIALKRGLAHLDSESRRRHGGAFVDLDSTAQDALLNDVQAGRVDWPGFPADRWFEELLAVAVLGYVASPRTLEAMGFDGVAFLPRQGEADIVLDARAAEERS